MAGIGEREQELLKGKDFADVARLPRDDIAGEQAAKLHLGEGSSPHRPEGERRTLLRIVPDDPRRVAR